MATSDPGLTNFLIGCAGAAAPEAWRLYNLRTRRSFTWSWGYLFCSVPFILIGGFIAWCLDPTTKWAAFYSGLTAPVLLTTAMRESAKSQSELEETEAKLKEADDRRREEAKRPEEKEDKTPRHSDTAPMTDVSRSERNVSGQKAEQLFRLITFLKEARKLALLEMNEGEPTKARRVELHQRLEELDAYISEFRSEISEIMRAESYGIDEPRRMDVERVNRDTIRDDIRHQHRNTINDIFAMEEPRALDSDTNKSISRSSEASSDSRLKMAPLLVGPLVLFGAIAGVRALLSLVGLSGLLTVTLILLGLASIPVLVWLWVNKRPLLKDFLNSL